MLQTVLQVSHIEGNYNINLPQLDCYWILVINNHFKYYEEIVNIIFINKYKSIYAKTTNQVSKMQWNYLSLDSRFSLIVDKV